jgi:hypothetical protein
MNSVVSRKRIAGLILLCAGLASCGSRSPETALRAAFRLTTGRIQLPRGTFEISTPLRLSAGAHDLEIVGDPAGSVIQMASNFQGKAAIVGVKVSRIRMARFQVRGSRTSLIGDRYLPPSDIPFAEYYEGNGLLFVDSLSIDIRDLSLEKVSAFPILISRCDDVAIDRVSIRDSGMLNKRGHNNTTGGILLEEGTSRFSVTRCHIRDVCGNAIWTHSNFRSPRNRDGRIEANEIFGVARDAIQAGHALRIRIAGNSGGQIGSPPDEVDVEALATPVALDSAGNVESSVYSDNHFTDVNGQCIDLDGFHDGQVTGNSCINKLPLRAYPFLHTGIVFGNSSPAMQPGRVLVSQNLIQGFGYGGLYLLGQDNRVSDNRFLDINRNHCAGNGKVPACNYALDEPGMLRSGIYLASHAARPARTARNTIERNFISGYGIARWCVVAGPGVKLSQSQISANKCVNLP